MMACVDDEAAGALTVGAAMSTASLAPCCSCGMEHCRAGLRLTPDGNLTTPRNRANEICSLKFCCWLFPIFFRGGGAGHSTRFPPSTAHRQSTTYTTHALPYTAIHRVAKRKSNPRFWINAPQHAVQL